MFGLALLASTFIVVIWLVFWMALNDLNKLELDIEITAEEIDNSFMENAKRPWADRK